MIRGFINKVIVVLFLMVFSIKTAYGLERIGVITDSILTPANQYNSYFRTPEFFAQDIRYELSQKNVNVIPVDLSADKLKKAGVTQRDLVALQNLQQGYNIDYTLLKKIAKPFNINKMVIVTMGMDVQRDFLKNTFWNWANIPGNDVVNPTHRISVYVTLVDIKNENVLWESIYAKNLRNNKFKNLDTTISNNYEGMLRLKEYSRYISPDIAYNVKMKMLNPNYVEPPTHITRENVKQYVKDRHNIGVKKELSEINRQKWDTDKFIHDSKENIKDKTEKTKKGIVKASKATAEGTKKTGNWFKNKANKIKSNIKKCKNNDWL